jgi:predicted RND superfamily exporter protein
LRDAATVDGRALPVAGSLVLSSDIATALKRDGPRTTALSLAAVLAICGLAFRSARLSAAAVVSVLAGVVLMLGAMAWGNQHLNFSNFVALPITFGIGADYAINVLKRHQSESDKSLANALSATGGAVALCSLTTIIGFSSLLIAQNRALFSFGVFAVAGEVACLATALLLLPSALAIGTGSVRVPRAATAP